MYSSMFENLIPGLLLAGAVLGALAVGVCWALWHFFGWQVVGLLAAAAGLFWAGFATRGALQ